MFEMKLATCAALMGVLPESTDRLKTSYLSRENTYRLVIVDFEVEEVRYALKNGDKQQHEFALLYTKVKGLGLEFVYDFPPNACDHR